MSEPPASPLSILHLTASSDAGGLSRYILDVSVAMRAQGHRVAVAGDVGAWQDRFDAAGVEYLRIPLKGGPASLFRAMRATAAFVRERGEFDVYHAHYRRAALLGRYLQRRSAAPLLCTLHLSHIDVSWHRRLLTDLGDFTHFASNDALAWAQAHRLCHPRRSIVIPHGVDLQRYRPPSDGSRTAARIGLALPEGARVAAYVGRLDDPKNVDWLLDVAGAWHSEAPSQPLLILIGGDGPHRTRLEAEVAARGLGSSVRLLGEIDPLPIYHATDALLLPSAREGFSYVCAEAMACGVAILRTRTSGTTETIIENVTGRSVDIDRDTFVRAALSFLKDPDALRAMGQAAAAHARERFALDRQIAATVDLYRRLSGKGST